ncbi:capsular polysaccharide biosynthesis protein CapF [Clostridium thermosuccinogenes]|uniref:capsular polysaccharide biosynthesis protein CapF n=1 Tax=Clostridium thermosuccinogenes TaxID=84032 RepID=UPI000CCC25F5|nr:capsular polysaccharide biosynthesis protein CapF [Pseudoclostridium thermosuccinogenes]PNT91548.1 capsular biosynthesis protein [Pseudoclostridium thermosuccinogenes]
MKILVTGAKGFIGKNLVAELKNRKYRNIFEYDIETNPSLLDVYCKEADFVFHLAGVNRPKEQSEFMKGNFGFTSTLLNTLKRHANNCPVMIASSIQATLDNAYGRSKKAGEDLLFKYGKETGARILVYRFPNVFGKWCKPNYNSAVATFCYNIAHDLPITVNDRSVVMNLVYIDDVVEELIRALNGKENRVGDFCEVPIVHTITLGEIVDLIYSFKNSREERSIPDMSDTFTKKLYSTYLSYMPEDQFSYELKMNVDNRGSFTEFIRTPDRGQVSVNISKPGITKGNHWHHTKNEKFLVVSGKGVIRLRKINSDKVIEYFVSGEKMEVVDIPAGYTHNIENLGETDMVTIMWANEPFDPDKLDTYFEIV